MRSMAEQVLGILAARKRMYAMRRPSIIAMVSLVAVQRLLETGVAGGIAVSDRVRRIVPPGRGRPRWRTWPR